MKNFANIERQRGLQRRLDVNISEGEANWLRAFTSGLRGVDYDNSTVSYAIRMLIMDNILRARKDKVITEEQAVLELQSLGMSSSEVANRVNITEQDL
jgi:DNA-binding NarL/FixJ family response regulator